MEEKECKHCVFEVEILGHKEAIKYLNDKDNLQNGSIQRIEKKVDEMHTFLRRAQWALIALLFGVLVDLVAGGKVTSVAIGHILKLF